MAQLDKEKEVIAFLKVIFLALIAIDSSLIAWLFNHPNLNLKAWIVIFLL